MSDLANRLREAARNAQVIEQHGILSLAADEIERLRAKNERLRSGLRMIKQSNNHYNFGSKLVRLVDAALAESEMSDDVMYDAAMRQVGRLEALVGNMLQAQHKQERKLVLQEAEIERLQAALRQAYEKAALVVDNHYWDTCSPQHGVFLAKTIRALGEAKDE